MKTLEKLARLAHEYSEKFYGCEIMASDINVAWFAGYETAQEHVHAALEEVEARIVELEDQIVGVSKVMNSPEKQDSWISVKEQLPPGNTKDWFVVLLDNVGCLKTIGSSQYINGDWLQIREGLVAVTHWAEMPKELP